jgi:CopG antitoxin of type II toxin-antitoxin system
MTAAKKEFIMKKKLKPIPHFRNEAEEREFWETHDTTDYFDWSKARRVSFPNLKLSTPSAPAPKRRTQSE